MPDIDYVIAHNDTGEKIVDFELPNPKLHFLDSGSFTLWTEAEKFAKETGKGEWEYYERDEFQQYLEDYAAFVKKYDFCIDSYANVDVLPFRTGRKPPKGKDSFSLTYDNQKRLEALGVAPVPVIHYTGNIDEWLRRYIEEGYPYIGLGGLVGSLTDQSCKLWVDKAFDLICQDSGHPCVKVHGFGVGAHEYLLRYPWFSVDHTTWAKHSAYGKILVPKYRRDRFIITQQDLKAAKLPMINWVEACQPWLVAISKDSKVRQQPDAIHYLLMKKTEQEIMRRWLDYIRVPLGNHKTGEMGALTHYNYRVACNVFFFHEVYKALPKIHDRPKWKCSRQIGFGLDSFKPIKLPKKLKRMSVPDNDDKTIMYMSGSGPWLAGPEYFLKEEAMIMRTFYDMKKGGEPDKSFTRLIKARKKALGLK